MPGNAIWQILSDKLKIKDKFAAKSKVYMNESHTMANNKQSTGQSQTGCAQTLPPDWHGPPRESTRLVTTSVPGERSKSVAARQDSSTPQEDGGGSSSVSLTFSPLTSRSESATGGDKTPIQETLPHSGSSEPCLLHARVPSHIVGDSHTSCAVAAQNCDPLQPSKGDGDGHCGKGGSLSGSRGPVMEVGQGHSTTHDIKYAQKFVQDQIKITECHDTCEGPSSKPCQSTSSNKTSSGRIVVAGCASSDLGVNWKDNSSTQAVDMSEDDINPTPDQYPFELANPGEQYDIALLYAEGDKEKARQCKEVLEEFIVLENGERPKICTLDMAPGGLTDPRCVEFCVRRSTFSFLYMTQNFCSDRWGQLQQDSVLMESINTEEKRWSVVPVFTENRTDARTYMPLLLSSLRGLDFSKVIKKKIWKDLDVDEIEDVLDNCKGRDMENVHKYLDKYVLNNAARMLNQRVKKKKKRKQELEKKLDHWIRKQRHVNKETKMRERLERELEQKAREKDQMEQHLAQERARDEHAKILRSQPPVHYNLPPRPDAPPPSTLSQGVFPQTSPPPCYTAEHPPAWGPPQSPHGQGVAQYWPPGWPMYYPGGYPMSPPMQMQGGPYFPPQGMAPPGWMPAGYHQYPPQGGYPLPYGYPPGFQVPPTGQHGAPHQPNQNAPHDNSNHQSQQQPDSRPEQAPGDQSSDGADKTGNQYGAGTQIFIQATNVQVGNDNKVLAVGDPAQQETDETDADPRSSPQEERVNHLADQVDNLHMEYASKRGNSEYQAANSQLSPNESTRGDKAEESIDPSCVGDLQEDSIKSNHSSTFYLSQGVIDDFQKGASDSRLTLGSDRMSNQFTGEHVGLNRTVSQHTDSSVSSTGHPAMLNHNMAENYDSVDLEFHALTHLTVSGTS